MLPDFPIVKELMYELLSERLREVHRQQLGFFGTLRSHKHVEGHRTRTERADGSVDDHEYTEVTSSRLITDDEYASITQDDITKRVTDLTEEMAEKVSGFAFERISEILEQTGNTIDHKGKPLTVDIFFEMLDSVWIDFDRNGRPSMPTIVATPTLRTSFERIFEEIEKSQEHRERHRSIFEQKWIDWRDREASRKLVG